jgi:hypothetical protein
VGQQQSSASNEREKNKNSGHYNTPLAPLAPVQEAQRTSTGLWLASLYRVRRSRRTKGGHRAGSGRGLDGRGGPAFARSLWKLNAVILAGVLCAAPY